MAYTTDHAFALTELAANGAAVTFTRMAAGYNAATGLVTPTETTVSGQAIQVRLGGAALERFRALGLVVEDGRRLLFAPTTLGQQPAVGDRCTWSGDVLTVRDVELVAPDGEAIIAYVTVAR
jgi:hypothetical protein